MLKPYEKFVKNRKTHVRLCLCKGCIDDLDEYNPYVDDDGKQIPRENIETIEVSQKLCYNTLITK